METLPDDPDAPIRCPTRLRRKRSEIGRARGCGRHLVRYLQPHPDASGSSRISASGARRSSTTIPASEAALARRKPSDPRLAERFELYCCGVELANAFGELTDPRATPPLRSGHGGEGAHLRRALSDRRGLSSRARSNAAGERHCARPRSPGDARDRRVTHRASDLDAGARTGNFSMNKHATLRRPTDLSQAGLVPLGEACRDRGSGSPLRRFDHARHGRINRCRRCRRPDRAPIPAQQERASPAARGARRSNR